MPIYNPGGGTFIDLPDTPATYVGQRGRAPRVNIGETALEFINPASLDWPLEDGIEGDHFKQYAATYPPGWTEVDPPVASQTNFEFSFWWFRGNAGNPSWDYQKQSGIDIEATPVNQTNSFKFGPILFRDGNYVADVDYLFAIHGETAGAIDLNKYARVHFQWNSAGGIWRVRGESRAGVLDIETAGAWFNLSIHPLIQPLYFRIMVRNDANRMCREYLGIQSINHSHTLLQQVNELTTWGQVYWRLSQTRGVGIEDYLYLGAVDYSLYA